MTTFFKPFLLISLLLSPLLSCADDTPAAFDKKSKNQDFKQQVASNSTANNTASNTASNTTSNTITNKPVDNNTLNNKIISSGDILSVARSEKGKPLASYFSTRAANKETLARHILDMLIASQANSAIIDFAKTRLPMHPFLKKSQFEMPVTAADGHTYRISYSSDLQNHLYILTVEHTGKSST